MRQGVDLNGDGVSDDSIISERAITLKIKVGDNPETSDEIKLDRPPIVLVHGLWSGPEMWVNNNIFNNLMNQFQGLTMPFLSYYPSTSDQSFEANRKVMEVSVDASKALMRPKELRRLRWM